MISAPRMMPLAKPMSCRRLHHLVSTPSATIGRPFRWRPGRRPGCLIDADDVELVSGVVDGRSVTSDLVGLVGDPAHGGDHHAGHQHEQPEHDGAGGQGRLQLCRWSHRPAA